MTAQGLSTGEAARAGGGSLPLAVALLWVTLLYNVFEGVIAVWAGLRAGSVALVAFGLDSGIEVTAAAALLWRLGVRDEETAARRELVSHRVVGATFLVLAAFIAAQIASKLISGAEPDSSRVGIGLAVASLTLMPGLAFVKRANARRLHSHALIAEATETIICFSLSATLLSGLALNAAFGWWWADPVASLVMSVFIVKEGWEVVRTRELVCIDD